MTDESRFSFSLFSHKTTAMPKITVSVINDLVTDQRVRKSCETFVGAGFDVHLVGRVLPQSLPMDEDKYTFHRIKLRFTKGPLFYAFFNFRLFFYLLFQKTDGLHSNDLDTLLPNLLVSKIRRLPLVYDSHEYFTEVPELQGRFVQKVWKFLEKVLIPRLDVMLTVNDSIADLYRQQSEVEVEVMRNFPKLKTEIPKPKLRSELGIAEDDFVIILQGAGINVDRGAEEAVESLRYLTKVKFLLVGGGDVLPVLHQLVEKYGLEEKIIFLPKQHPKDLPSYTAMADLGLSLDKDTNLNYRFSLPNKIFDYVSCGVPVLASNLPEVAKLVRGYELGVITESHDPEAIAEKILEARNNNLKTVLVKKMQSASKDLCWENESIILASLWKERLPNDK
jgi:glycosyltransferase involved in cell wall biosynthesis